jgi:hypothetical protein
MVLAPCCGLRRWRWRWWDSRKGGVEELGVRSGVRYKRGINLEKERAIERGFESVFFCEREQ